MPSSQPSKRIPCMNTRLNFFVTILSCLPFSVCAPQCPELLNVKIVIRYFCCSVRIESPLIVN